MMHCNLFKILSSNISSINKEVANVDVNSKNPEKTEVKIMYKHKGKLLWFIPVTVKSTTTVDMQKDSAIEVKSNLPWWSFLITGENYNRANLESSIKNNTIVQAGVNTNINASAQSKAKVALAIIEEIRANATAEANTK